MKDAIRDGIRAVKNTIEDGYILPGAAAFEIAAYLVFFFLQFTNFFWSPCSMNHQSEVLSLR